MEILLGFFIAIIGLLLVSAIRSLTTLFHEMGHALPALFFTDGNVNVYIGTYGDVSKGIQLNFGRLFVFFRINLFDWKLGMCSFEPERTTWKAILILLGGPLASLIISIPLLYIVVNYHLSDMTIFFISSFMMAAAIDFAVNMFPFSSPINMHDGAVSYSDGSQLLRLLARTFLPKEYLELENLYSDKKYIEVIDHAEVLITKKPDDIAIYYLAINACAAAKQFEDGLWFYEQLKNQQELQLVDYRQIAQFYLELDKNKEALQCLDYYLNHQKEDIEAYLERGQVLLQQKEYIKALADVNLGLHLEADHPKLITLKGMLMIQLGNEAEGIQLLHTAEALGEKSTGMFNFLADYYNRKGQHETAQGYQNKAQTLSEK